MKVAHQKPVIQIVSSSTNFWPLELKDQFALIRPILIITTYGSFGVTFQSPASFSFFEKFNNELI